MLCCRLYCPTSPECLRWRYWELLFRSNIGCRPRTGCCHFLCANISCFTIALRVLPVWCSVTDGLLSCCRRQAAVCCKCLLGFFYCRCPATHRGMPTPWCVSRIPLCGWTQSRPAGRRLRRPAVPPSPVWQLPRSTLTAAVLLSHHIYSYALHDRRHNFSLTCRLNSIITDCNFITRQLLKDCYWLTDSDFTTGLLSISCHGWCGLSYRLINERDDDDDGVMLMMMAWCWWQAAVSGAHLCHVLEACLLYLSARQPACLQQVSNH